MNETRRQMLDDGTHRLDQCRVAMNAFFSDAINDWSSDCQNKTDIELAKSLKRIMKLTNGFNELIGTYADAVEADV